MILFWFLFSFVGGIIAGWGVYTKGWDTQFYLSIGITTFFGILTATGLVYTFHSAQTTESLVKQQFLPIDNFPCFVEIATEIVKRVKENDVIMTISVTPALGEVLSPTLHRKYKDCLVDAVTNKKIEVTFWHSKLAQIHNQFTEWKKDNKKLNVNTLKRNLNEFFGEVYDSTTTGRGQAKSVILEDSIPPFLAVLSSSEIAVCQRPEKKHLYEGKELRGFYTKSPNARNLFAEAIKGLPQETTPTNISNLIVGPSNTTDTQQEITQEDIQEQTSKPTSDTLPYESDATA